MDESNTFLGGSCLWQVYPLNEPLDDRFIVPWYHGPVQQLIRPHLNVALCINQWKVVGLWNHFGTDVAFQLAHMKDRVDCSYLVKGVCKLPCQSIVAL
jgi:hypothetical protein